MIQELLNSRHLPPLRSREEMLSVLLSEAYGTLPPKPERVEFSVKEDAFNRNYCAGKAKCDQITARCLWEDKEFTFSFYFSYPISPDPVPFFVSLNFDGNVPNRYLPAEEIMDNGYAFLAVNYQDVSCDREDFTDGLAGVLFENGHRLGTDAGKISMWAWAAQRMMDYAQTRPELLDLARGIVCGHSRLGKTALLAAATDERFAAAYSNDSGCMGASLSRGKVGEDVAFIGTKFHRWFCEDFQKYVKAENGAESLPFDQHWLIACIAPRPVLVGSASEDEWADPNNEFLSCVAAGAAFEGGFVCEDRLPVVGDVFYQGSLGYHLRAGRHYFARTDWQNLIRFANEKLK